DTQTHDAALAMGEAAARSDGHAVITEFAKLQQSCLTCHENYRQSFKDHFYAQSTDMQAGLSHFFESGNAPLERSEYLLFRGSTEQ
ncbi:MAG TPA: hypothetical protein PKH39_14805, partial [Woeseiaceae bacterium]|nr:hypothetical protein [Woeseiaceae bacterium]